MSNAETRNSALRKLISIPVEHAVDYIDREHPKVTPTMISLATTAGMLGLNYLSVKHPERGLMLGLAETAVVTGDILDGGLARKKAENNGTKLTSSGSIIDATLDKIQESAHGLASSQRAANNGDRLGGVLHALSGITSPMPALMKAKAEANGVIVPEGGSGTRVSRAAMNIVSTGFLRERPKTAQALSALMIAQNLRTAHRRNAAAEDPTSPYAIGTLEDPEKIDIADSRYEALKATAGIIAVAGAVHVARVMS